MGPVKKHRPHYQRELFESYYLHHAKRHHYKRFVCIRVIKAINEMAMNRYVFRGLEYEFPAKMGSISIIATKQIPFFMEDKLVATKPIDWKSTFKLWKEDEDAKRRKLFVRFTDEYIYRFLYKKHPFATSNCWVMKIRASREHKQKLKQLIEENKIFVQTK